LVGAFLFYGMEIIGSNFTAVGHLERTAKELQHKINDSVKNAELLAEKLVVNGEYLAILRKSLVEVDNAIVVLKGAK
jgi:hypothetical protein